MTITRRFAPRLACALAFLAAALTAPSARAAVGPAVTLQDQSKTVLLSNGLLAATIDKSAASITSLKYRGFDMLNAGYYSMDGGKSFEVPHGCVFSVKTRTPDLVDIGMKRTWTNSPHAVDIDIHYVMQRGKSGLYSYALLDHPASYPALGMGEWRMVWKLSNDTLEKIYVDDLRHWQMPSSEDYKHAESTPIKEIVKLTTGPWAGKYDCKYDYSAEYYDIGCWGHASDRNKVGGFIVLGGYDYFNDGPTKQDLNAASGINHIHFGMDHYNGSSTRVPAGQKWEKIYGPFLLYCNSSPQGGDACWADARAQVKKEQAEWPYSWLTNNAAYPPDAQRGTVTGRLVVHDPLKPNVSAASAWVGLAHPPEGHNWQFDSMSYQYWTRADADGKFTIPHVRPGNYTLYAFTTGAVREFSKPDVTVTSGQTTSEADLAWQVPHKGRSIAWEIGVPDRTAKEFRHGDNYFHGYLWENFDKEFSNPLVYTVGKSDWSKDWNYAQTRYKDGEKFVPHRWEIHFDLPSVPSSGNATLTLAIASAQRARIDVFVNNGAKPLADVTPSVAGGNALLREGIHAKYCVEYVSIPVAKLKRGANVIALQIPETSGPDSHVMYDYLNLELP